MFLKPGDRVIKNTGGNKMTVISCTDEFANCVWYTENYHESTFKIKDLLPLNQYDRIKKLEKRDDLISQILKS